MSNKLLLPNRYKKIGWFILLPATIAGVVMILTNFEAWTVKTQVFAVINDEFLGNRQLFEVVTTNITPTLTGILFIIGALLVCFSKEKNEDEFIANLRLTSLMWAVLVNYILLLFSFAFIYGTYFLNVMLYNMFTVLIIFIVRFNYVLYKNYRLLRNDK